MREVIIKGKIDFRAEVIAAELSENVKNLSSVRIDRKGAFQRNYSKDISQISQDDEGAVIVVNREGFYDFLPQEIFHFDSYNPTRKSFSFKEKHVQIKKQEEEARAFFTPLENEFSNVLILAENKERNIFDLSTYNQFVKNFFEQEHSFNNLNELQKAKFNFFFPLAYKFKGKPDFISYFLKSVLNLEVKCLLSKRETELYCAEVPLLSSMILGVTSVLDIKIKEKVYHYELKFLNLKRSQAILFLPGSEVFNLIKYVHELFMQHHSTMSISLKFSEEEMESRLNDRDDVSLLGYNSYLT